MSHRSFQHGIGSLSLVLSAFCSIAGIACGSQSTDTGTETHWLQACDSDAECGGATSCLCGVCTIQCGGTSSCPEQAPVCASLISEAVCGNEVSAVCVESSRSTFDFVSTGGDTLHAPSAQLQLRSLPEANTCDEMGWCWDSPPAPGEYFQALSKDGRYAVGVDGLVFDTSAGYLPRRGNDFLESVVTSAESMWVAGEGVWRWTGDDWVQETDALVRKLAIDQTGTLWGVSSNEVFRRDNGEWTTVELPHNSAYDATLLLYDVATRDDGSVWVLGGYTVSNQADATMFVLEDDEWREYASHEPIAPVFLLDGKDTFYVYNIASEDLIAHVFDPERDWNVVASVLGPVDGAAFWGPDNRLWTSTAWTDLEVFGTDRRTIVSDVEGCASAVTWDDDTVLCADQSGGLTYLSSTGNGEIQEVRSSTVSPRSFEPEAYGELPPALWALAGGVWAASADDAWRSPLEHFDGNSWQSHLDEGDEFSAIRIDGTATDDVWFVSGTDVRHWDGSEVTTVDVPASESATVISSLRAIDESEVWIMRSSVDGYSRLELLRFDGQTWEVSNTTSMAGTPANAGFAGFGRTGGSLTGSKDNLWAAFGDTVLHYDGTEWGTQGSLPSVEGHPPEQIMDAVADERELWILTYQSIYRLEDGEFVLRGYRGADLDNLALTEDYVWNFDVQAWRKLPR